MSDLNGVAHVILTAGDFARSTAFWRDMIRYLDLKIVLDSDYMLYGVGGRTAIGIRTGSPENAGKRFDQGPPDCTMPVSGCATAPLSTPSAPS